MSTTGKNWGIEPRQLAEIQRFCKMWPRDAEQSVIVQVQNDLKQISANQQRDAPRRTGFMASNTVFEATKTGGQAVSKAEYAIFVDQGTYRMPARPFFSSYIPKNIPNMEAKAFNVFAQSVNRYLR